jgi:hypothetical protein
MTHITLTPIYQHHIATQRILQRAVIFVGLVLLVMLAAVQLGHVEHGLAVAARV